MATFLFIMIVLALLALVVTLVVFTLSQRKKAAKSARQLPRPLPGITGFHTDFDRITLP